MASKSNFFYSSVMPKIYGIGAAVVILGAMFKILDWQGANIMIGVGLTTEAAIFFLSAFEPRPEEVDWTKVYPELAGDGPAPKKARATAGAGDQVSQKLDDMLANAKVGPELIESLGKGMQNLASSAEKMGNLADAAVATNEYATNVKTAAKTLVDMNASYGKTAAALTEMSAASQDAKEYHNQVVTVTKNLSALNAVYEMELQDANSHVKTLNKFYSNMTAAMEGLSEAGKETEAFKNELAKLNQNVSSLNKIYGGMLSAMKG
ncbi:gliding motility-associated protein GldL [Algoriphagus ornithinivorans]|jgi:gliding motility-associated protein GldL|uniref:Gliding motility-associated protein GldL n=2 Tax=Algoriphagus TaxID=246875 RepID=A0A1I5ETN9_9BACT|nr:MULTISPECIES: gliding motility protein GldL [Algoriphagus]MAL12329.1 gliding motility protein GldL [Algoriphagus sp.]MAN88611.1 gliding motility protein GldL [Algoriphagus sp.]QYH40182.1 gliding motility protein GldL [Algoriphagus sp. NBT04N3]SFO14892.1 gliding motility-associated protein GldL [Algoriphagus ornithinivorans]HAD51874.1 gliding motility protein GldL [Algoriphagus sp.]|tara:strand:- start:6736 stop:7527 length:792 start_codon:yes stop_codon:yes gene_type:complete